MEDKNAKLVIFSKGDDKFIEDIANKLSAYYEIKRITINMLHMEKLEEWMKWADICWFEWCDELLVYASRLDIAKEKKIICRLHSYEAFTNYPARVNWACVDSLIFVSETIRRYAINTFGIDEKITTVIPNGVDLAHFNFENRNQGFNIAYAGYINYKKGPMLLLQVFKALYDSDNRYKFYIAGQFQDPRYSLYFKQMVAEFGLEKNYYFEGWQKNLDKWLEDKNYILCTSVLESQNMSVMQAMAKGIKPVIHNFVGASEIYPNKYLWNTISEAVFTIRDNEYNSGEYRDFVVDNYSLDMQLKSTVSLLENISIKIKKQVNQNQKLRREFSEKEDNSTFEYIHDKMNEFISYETNDFDSFDFTTAKAIIGKRERFNRYELIEFILNNSQNKKLIINSIWYDLYNKEYILPEQIRNSKNSDEILLIASDIIKKDVVYKNNIAGFISDPEIKADVEQNYLAYMWERGIPASQFLPINVYLRIAERYTFAAGT
ncbi:glycosyltransferase family 4 protein [Ruminiclostridium josui]|uniref:glycosyltransferase family 4 protein n=1 Tax=Ruminiclostridium josui TaxID=1499 RepID=UPI000A62B0D6|nr:glycosyltransferase family 4 protein [Ruminiclostridium josui]